LTVDFGHEIFYDMARAARALGDDDAALAFIERTLERNNYWPSPYIERGQILFERGDLAGARENYLMAYETAYGDPELQAAIEELLAGLTK
jgi:predicted negative regulator of RcsB-dependent stress response